MTNPEASPTPLALYVYVVVVLLAGPDFMQVYYLKIISFFVR